MLGAVTDTGPLHYLIPIDAIALLPSMFDRVCAPIEVRAELTHPEAPAKIRAWAGAPPAWLSILPAPLGQHAGARYLDDGERAVIALSVSLRPDLILMDDRAGVVAARAAGFAVTGTLGLLATAARHGLIDLPTAFVALRSTNFHVRPELLDHLLARHRQHAP